MSGSTSSNNFIGSGSDTIVLNMAEDQAVGEDAQFTVNVDGQQIGGVETVTASHSSGQNEAFTFAGNYDAGSHEVTVTFVNNFIYPGVSGDRNLYVNGVTYDGQTVSNNTTGIYVSPFFPPNSTSGNYYGDAQYSVNDTTSTSTSNSTSTPGAVSIGSGSDTLALNMAEDPYQGDAQFTVSVDGQQIGGVQTTTAVVEQGQTQTFDVHGNFGSGTHTVAVTYLNDQVGGYYPAGTPGLPSGQWALDTTDRNLYVMGASLNGGTPASGLPWELSSSGTKTFNVTSGSNSGSSATFGSDGAAVDNGNVSISSGSLSAGSGSSSGMSFVSSSTGTTTDTSSSTTTSSGSSDSTAATTPTVASTASTAAQTTQDFTTPATTSSATNTTTSTTGAGNSNWWLTHQSAGGSGITHSHHG